MAKFWYASALKDAILNARVLAGAAFLDRVKGKKSWRRQVKLQKLALESGTACILGQVDGDFSEAEEKYGLTIEEEKQLGFMAPDGVGWDTLTRAWKNFLRAERRAGRR